MEKICVSVPATSANVGAGFDAIGLALGLYNTVAFFPAEGLEIFAADGTEVPGDESNLVYAAVRCLYEKAGETVPGLRIVQTNPIPMARGLGSSSACIIAGLLGANRMLGEPFGRAELLEFATEMEGHPDNVAPALLGGFVSSIRDGGKVYAVRRDLDDSLAFAAVIPDYPLLTSAARAALPQTVPHADAVFNLSRTALLGEAFCSGRHDLLPVVTQDRLHQRYRMALMPGAEYVFSAAKELGARAIYVSGAGSTMMAVVEQADAYSFCTGMKAALAREAVCKNFALKRLSVDNRGATVE
jgi:homoserine kinase